MSVKKISILILSVLFLITYNLSAQVTKEADNAFRTCKYEKALESYRQD